MRYRTLKLEAMELIERTQRTSASSAAANENGSPMRPWLVPTGLVVLALMPIAAGATRVVNLARGVAVNPENARFFASPLPVVLHVIGATLFSVLGALQFAPSLRRQRWHRIAGRVTVPAGLVAALSGLWMAFVYPLPAGENHALLKAFRLVLGASMVLALVLGALSIRRRDFAAHRAWMMRSYAIGMGAGTQALVMVPWWLLFGKPSGITYALLMGFGWGLNLVVAEQLIRLRGDAGRLPSYATCSDTRARLPDS